MCGQNEGSAKAIYGHGSFGVRIQTAASTGVQGNVEPVLVECGGHDE